MARVTMAVMGASLLLSQEAAAKPPAEWGGFGFATVVGFVADWSQLEGDLDGPDALGPAFDVTPLGLQVGGGARALLGQWFVLGGKGVAWFAGGDRPDPGEVTLFGGGGGFDLGVAAYNRHHTLVYPYLGLGGYTLSVEVQNHREEPLRFGPVVLGQGQSRAFDAAFFTADFGIGIQRLMFFGEREDLLDGGLLAGFEGGFTVPIIKGAVTDGALSDLGVTGVYLRLTLGGGGFLFSDDPRYLEEERNYEDEDLDYERDYDDF